MLYSDLSYTAQEAAIRNVMGLLNTDNEELAIFNIGDFLFDMNGDIIEEQDNY